MNTQTGMERSRRLVQYSTLKTAYATATRKEKQDFSISLIDDSHSRHRAEARLINKGRHPPVAVPGCIYSFEPRALASYLDLSGVQAVQRQAALSSRGVSVAVVGKDARCKPATVELVVIQYADMMAYVRERADHN